MKTELSTRGRLVETLTTSPTRLHVSSSNRSMTRVVWFASRSGSRVFPWTTWPRIRSTRLTLGSRLSAFGVCGSRKTDVHPHLVCRPDLEGAAHTGLPRCDGGRHVELGDEVAGHREDSTIV